MMKELVFATNNQHKLSEVKAMLEPAFKIISLSELGCTDDIPETENTLEGNARLKARYIRERFGVDCFADDTGLEVDALNGEPGVFSARYAGEPSNAAANVEKLLNNMAALELRTACFRTVICLLMDDSEFFFEGKVTGHISRSVTGTAGFGYDPVFVPAGYTKTFAELSASEKNKISHRGLAVEQLVAFLTNK